MTRQQLVALGFGRSAIEYRVRTLRLHRLHRGVYAVGHARLSRFGRLIAAVLACGHDAVLSHHSAAALWGIKTSDRRLIDVSAPRHSHGRRPGICLHLLRDMNPDDRNSVEGIPVTTVARTLLDLAASIPGQALARAIEQAERLQLFDLHTVDAIIARNYRRPGVGALKSALLAYRELPPLTRSELERRFLDLCREAGLPPPAVNVWIAGHEVDFVWAEQRLIVELDGRSFHQTRAAFERDRIRDEALQLAGCRVLRVTRRRLETDAAGVVRTIRALVCERAGAR